MNLLSLALVPTAFFAAEGATSWTDYLLNGGPFAIVVALVVMDKMTNTSERDRLRIDNEILRGEIKVLNESIRTDIVPPLVQINSLMKDVIRELGSRGQYFTPDKREG